MSTLSNSLISAFPLDPPTKPYLIDTMNDNNSNNETSASETTASKLLRNYQLPAQFYACYSLGQELGSGGFGFVVSVKERSSGLERAVKFIYKNKVPSSAWVVHKGQKLPMEIYVLKHVQHCNIVGYVDSFEDDTYYYLVMELHGSQWNQPSLPTTATPAHIPGLSHTSEPSDDDDDSEVDDKEENQEDEKRTGDEDYPITIGRRGSCDLFECIEQHRTFDESLAKIIFRQIVECVAHLDKMGICHRDIKDENIVIDSNYKVKLIDFGSAVTLPRHYKTNDKASSKSAIVLHRKFYGTIAFASPEILRMEPYQAEPAEVWSLGILLYTLVYGEVPFANPRMALNAQLSPPPTNSPKVSSKCWHLISCLLEKTPRRRPTVHQILTHPWLRQQ